AGNQVPELGAGNQVPELGARNQGRELRAGTPFRNGTPATGFGRPGSATVAREADARCELAERRHRIRLRARDQQHGAETGVRVERVDEELQADRERERLVRLRAAERDELLRSRDRKSV